jgi:hypothetical protein
MLYLAVTIAVSLLNNAKSRTRTYVTDGQFDGCLRIAATEITPVLKNYASNSSVICATND